jgi:hypothetical protein
MDKIRTTRPVSELLDRIDQRENSILSLLASGITVCLDASTIGQFRLISETIMRLLEIEEPEDVIRRQWPQQSRRNANCCDREKGLLLLLHDYFLRNLLLLSFRS